MRLLVGYKYYWNHSSYTSMIDDPWLEEYILLIFIYRPTAERLLTELTFYHCCIADSMAMNCRLGILWLVIIDFYYI